MAHDVPEDAPAEDVRHLEWLQEYERRTGLRIIKPTLPHQATANAKVSDRRAHAPENTTSANGGSLHSTLAMLRRTDKELADELDARDRLRVRGYMWKSCPKCHGYGQHPQYGHCFSCDGKGGRWEAPLMGMRQRHSDKTVATERAAVRSDEAAKFKNQD